MKFNHTRNVPRDIKRVTLGRFLKRTPITTLLYAAFCVIVLALYAYHAHNRTLPLALESSPVVLAAPLVELPIEVLATSTASETPVIEVYRVLRVVTKTVTAYNSVRAQTDDSPCIAAYGDNVCELEAKGDHSCAGAFKRGTKLSIPGKGICTVRDVLAKKYAHRVDWYEGGASKIVAAKAWGMRVLEVSVIE